MTARTIDIWFFGDGTTQRVPVTAHDTPVAGLVVNPAPRRPGLWTVTHEASGAAVLTLPHPEAALHAAIRLGDLADWTLPGTVLREQPGLGTAISRLADELACTGMSFEGRLVSAGHLALAESGGA